MQEDLNEARRVLDIETKAIEAVKARLDQSFVEAVNILAATSGKVVVTGVGKSGQIARKIASTLSSTGTPSFYLHPTESSHGDLGMLGPGDSVVAISYSGESRELQDVMTFCARKNLKLIAITGVQNSPLAEAANVTLDISVSEEACPLKLAPTASSTATLALGDALSMVLLKRKGFQEKDFAEFHPGGSLGRKLLTRVRDVVSADEELPLVEESTAISEVIVVMTGYGKGAAAVVSTEGDLVGAITDGDIRRRLGKGLSELQGAAKDLMSGTPKTVDANELAQKALFLMEQFKINLLFVVDSSSSTPKKPIGLLHIQDLIRANIR